MKISKKYSYYFILGLMFLCTILLRVYKLAQLPDILHIDEAGLGCRRKKHLSDFP